MGAAAAGRADGIYGGGDRQRPGGAGGRPAVDAGGHAVTVFERDPAPGGLLRFGIPDYKLEKSVVDLRIAQLEAEGTTFECGVDAGTDVGGEELKRRFDAVILATGAQAHRDVDLPGRDLAGIEFAMPYLTGRNRALGGYEPAAAPISAAGKHVVVLGGGDTSADCLGFALREGAASVVEVAHGPTPPTDRAPLRVWPDWPFVLRSYAVHGEGGERHFELEPLAFEGRDGAVTGVRLERVEFPGFDGVGRRPPAVHTGEQLVLPADLVLLAVGFTGSEPSPLYAQLARWGGVFAAGDHVRGADLIVTAIADGRRAAAECHRYLAARPAVSYR